jgi:glucose/mannose-6-phosphate isomerase
MIDLNDITAIQQLDPKKVFESTGMLSSQIRQIVDEYWDVEIFSETYKDSHIENVVICGMGGSAYGGHIANALFHTSKKMPIEVNSTYELPGYVNEKTLVLLVSYSGNTEEVLSCADAAKERNAKIAGFSTAGELGEILRKSYPGFTFHAKYNPSGQPRLGTGYVVFGTIYFLSKIGAINVSKDEILQALDEFESSGESIKQHAQKVAHELVDRIPVILASGFLDGNAHIMRNQFNETSKSFSAFSDIPELNHHLMEGLKNPKDKVLTALILESDLYSEIVKKRVALTKTVIEKNEVPLVTFKPSGSTKLTQVMQTLSFGGYVTVYLGLLYGLDPSLIPWVDFFKDELKK